MKCITLHLKDSDTIKKPTALCDRYLVRIKFIPDFQQYTRSRRVEITFYENTPVLSCVTSPWRGRSIYY
jgi:undecaprenyl-phosphate galactose phosphotransferase/putative colanic acid biosynthesis UDP-glucose lipid carrier transferase